MDCVAKTCPAGRLWSSSVQIPPRFRE
jgi:hypothetical protein